MRRSVQKHGSKGGSENPHFLLLEVEGEYTSTRASASTCTCSAGARVTDDGSLCLGVSRFGVSNSASHCELRHWKNPNSRALATLCDNLCRSMEARGDQKIHTFYCWRLKESTPASCHCLQCCCALVCVSVCVVVGETGLYTTCSYQRFAVLEAGSKSGTTHSLDLTLRSFCQPPPAIKSVDRMTA